MNGSNLEVLANKFPLVHNLLERKQQELENSDFFVTDSRSGDPTVYQVIEGKKTFWHSQYNPLQEAVNLISKYEDVSGYNHILFYGAGLGYHIEEFARRFPNKKYSIYEPEVPLFYRWISNRPNSLRPLTYLQNIYLETHPSQVMTYLDHLLQHTDGQVLLIVHPSYERMVREKAAHFLDSFKSIVKVTRYNLAANEAFETSWVFNGTLNMRHTLQTPSYMQYKSKIADKPVLIVSAGPSLQDEIENLKKIREENSAYIFAVGSANKALVNNGIMPHAVCAYDGSDLQTSVFKEIIEQNIDNIPLFYGSYVGAMLLEKYPGPKVHFTMPHDTIAQYILSAEPLEEVNITTSPTIAGVMLDILCRLTDRIYFVGQNLALQGTKYYADKIHYEHLPESVISPSKEVLTTTDVFGNQVNTTQDFIYMKRSIEGIREQYPKVSVYNTTNGGAAIEGVPYRSLKEVMATEFKAGDVEETWYKDMHPDLHLERALNQVEALHKSFTELKNILDKISDYLSKIFKHSEQRKANKIFPLFPKFDAAVQEMLRNDAYKTLLLPINKNAHNLLWKKINDMKTESNVFVKGNLIAQNFGSYIYQCQKSYGLCTGIMAHLMDTKNIEQKKLEDLKTRSASMEVEVGGAL